MTLEYQIREAKNGALPVPAIVLLHGYGSNDDDLFSFADYLPQNHTIISLRAPLDTPMGGYAWYTIHNNMTQDKWSDDEEAKISIKSVSDQLEELVEKHNLDSNDITLMGFSQGAILSWAILLDNPDKVRRAICMSGYINKNILKNSITSYTGILAFGSHGSEDVTVPYSWAKDSIELLKAKNPSVIFNTYPDGHNVSAQSFQDIIKWLEVTNLK